MLIEYLLFIGIGLYFATTVMFFLLWIRTMRTHDGIGLVFLKLLTGGISIGSCTIFIVRIWSEYGNMPILTARAIAIVNPIVLLGVGLYLNYLFNSSRSTLIKTDNQNIKDIKADVKESNVNIKIIKRDMIKKSGVK